MLGTVHKCDYCGQSPHSGGCPPPVDREDAALATLRVIERRAYLRGLHDGLAVAERIRGWLTRQPDTKRQREVREWADKAIAAAKEER